MSYPMCLVRYETFARLGKLVAHEQLRDTHKLVYLNTVKSVLRLKKRKSHIIFFSHQWLSRTLPDPANDHYNDMMSALHGLAQMFHVRLESLYIFVDYSSIPQQGQKLQKLAIDSLATYVSLSSAFVIVSPQTVHRESQGLCNFDTYANRFWCRLEVFCTILSSLREKELRAVEAVQLRESDEEEDDEQAVRESQQRATKMSELSQQQRVFVVVKNSLHCLNFFTPSGALQPRYHDLLRLFEGQCTCCEQGHKECEEHLCDKCRVVDSLTGAYGAMLQDLRKAKRNHARGTLNHVPESHVMLVEEIVRQRADLFPAKYFETRIDAVHARLDRGLVSDGDGGDRQAMVADMDDHVAVPDVSDSDGCESQSPSSQPSSTDPGQTPGSSPSQIRATCDCGPEGHPVHPSCEPAGPPTLLTSRALPPEELQRRDAVLLKVLQGPRACRDA
jgi:hypothetical protein